jgi:hypothetical protein
MDDLPVPGTPSDVAIDPFYPGRRFIPVKFRAGI